MNRGRCNFTPSPRGRGRGGSRASPSSSGSADCRSPNPVGAEPTPSGHLSGDRRQSFGHRKEMFSGGRQTSPQMQTVWKQVQPVASEVSAGPECPLSRSRDRTDCEVSSPELNNRAVKETFSGRRQTSMQTVWKQVQPVASEVSAGPGCPLLRSRDRTDCEVSSPELNNRAVKETFSGGRQTSQQMQTVWKQVQPVASEVSAGPGCPLSRSRDRTDSEVRSAELNNQAEIVGSDIMQFGESDSSSDFIQEGYADGRLALDRTPKENLRSLHAKSGVSREMSWQRNEKPIGQRFTSWQGDKGWKQARPVAYESTSAQELNCRAEIVGGDLTQSGNSADGPLALDRSLMTNIESPHEKSSVSTEYTTHDGLSRLKDPESVGGSENSNKRDSPQHSECAADAKPFDICPSKGGLFQVKSTLLEVNRERRNQIKCYLSPKGRVLRSGMVLLKNYVSVPEQVKIVKECKKLGLSTGGFYQPGYRDGAKLSLRMMCLGKNWDPETSSYGDIRPIDGAKPPPIPSSFLELVKRSIKESHTLISKECGSTGRGVEAILPLMLPDICIVNFYTVSGRLGLHQDRDESESSLHKGLPVVSISIGDKAEFLYSNQRDVDKAEKVTLESGDVLIFGGESRHVFHGVSSIKSDTAPKSMLDETNLRPGRLNLTFRQY